MEHNNEHIGKHTVSFKDLMDLLLADNELDEEDLSYEEKPAIVGKDCLTLRECITEKGWDYEETYRFPYDDYKIVGDTANIDKIINAEGIMNIDVGDIISILSTDTLNYVTVGVGTDITKAVEQSVDNLPITTDNVGKMLLQILIPHNHKLDYKSYVESISKYQEDIDIFFGFAYDESLVDGVKVILIAASK